MNQKQFCSLLLILFFFIRSSPVTNLQHLPYCHWKLSTSKYGMRSLLHDLLFCFMFCCWYWVFFLIHQSFLKRLTWVRDLGVHFENFLHFHSFMLPSQFDPTLQFLPSAKLIWKLGIVIMDLLFEVSNLCSTLTQLNPVHRSWNDRLTRCICVNKMKKDCFGSINY